MSSKQNAQLKVVEETAPQPDFVVFDASDNMRRVGQAWRSQTPMDKKKPGIIVSMPMPDQPWQHVTLVLVPFDLS